MTKKEGKRLTLSPQQAVWKHQLLTMQSSHAVIYNQVSYPAFWFVHCLCWIYIDLTYLPVHHHTEVEFIKGNVQRFASYVLLCVVPSDEVLRNLIRSPPCKQIPSSHQARFFHLHSPTKPIALSSMKSGIYVCNAPIMLAVFRCNKLSFFPLEPKRTQYSCCVQKQLHLP